MLDRRGIELLDGVVSISRYAHDLIANFYSGKHRFWSDQSTPSAFALPTGPSPKTHRAELASTAARCSASAASCRTRVSTG